jgi:hypothetical protein
MKVAKGIKDMGGPLAMMLSSLKELKKITESGGLEAVAEAGAKLGEEQTEKMPSVELPDLSLDTRRKED